MTLTDLILDIFAPLECLNCHIEGAVLCNYCIHEIPTKQPLCFECKGLIIDSKNCIPGCELRSINRLFHASEYNGIVRQLVVSMKSHNLKSAARSGAILIAKSLDFDRDTIITPLPTATARIRQRGYDQADLLSRELAKLTKQPKIKFLLKNNQSRQVGSSKLERQANALHAYRVINKKILIGAKVLLVDDVMTTGASLAAAAALLLENGATNVDVAVLALATKRDWSSKDIQ